LIQADVSHDSSKLQLNEHIRTQFTPHRPAYVLSVTVFADLNQYLSAASDKTPAVSIAIVGYVQTKSSRKTMKSWMSDRLWPASASGIHSQPESQSQRSCIATERRDTERF
jgi:hypothetical protein